MNKNHPIAGWLMLLALATFNLQPSTARAQGTAFTYQGQLNSGTNPANGSYDLRLLIYDSSTGGNVLGGPVTNTAVAVSNGLFTTIMDFGAGVFTGSSNWLHIGVRTNGATSFTPLSPRQELTPTPYAVFAEGASAGGLSGTIPAASLSGAYSSPVTLSNVLNSFSGNGAGLTNVNASLLGGLAASSFWQTTGNAGTAAGVNFLGTTDNQPLQLRSDNATGLQLQYVSRSSGQGINRSTAESMNIVGGYGGNTVASNVIGATIAGGGELSGSVHHSNAISQHSEWGLWRSGRRQLQHGWTLCHGPGRLRQPRYGQRQFCRRPRRTDDQRRFLYLE